MGYNMHHTLYPWNGKRHLNHLTVSFAFSLSSFYISLPVGNIDSSSFYSMQMQHTIRTRCCGKGIHRPLFGSKTVELLVLKKTIITEVYYARHSKM
jgi:hypothetical protein